MAFCNAPPANDMVFNCPPTVNEATLVSVGSKEHEATSEFISHCLFVDEPSAFHMTIRPELSPVRIWPPFEVKSMHETSVLCPPVRLLSISISEILRRSTPLFGFGTARRLSSGDQAMLLGKALAVDCFSVRDIV